MEKIRQEELLMSQQSKTSIGLCDAASAENQPCSSEVIDEDNEDIAQDITGITAVHTSTIEVKINRDRAKDNRMFMKVQNIPFNAVQLTHSKVQQHQT